VSGPTVSTLVVSWNSRGFLGRCLESLPVGTEIVVVDNASTDGSADLVAEKFPQAKLIRLDHNIGFAAGVNRAFQDATGDYILLLNPDAEATPRAVDSLTAFLDEHATCGAVTGRLLSMIEEPQHGFNVRRLPTYASLATDLLLVSHIWPTNPITRRASAADLDESKPVPVEQPAGACLMVRRRAFVQLGGMDERFYPVWYEDVDLCKRLLEAGWTIFFVPRAVFRHVGGSSVRTLGREAMKHLLYRNLERYMRKHHGRLGATTTRMLVVTGMGLRVAGSAVKGDGAGVRMYASVMRDAIGGWRRVIVPTVRPEAAQEALDREGPAWGSRSGG
jgi:N-acetylglucosaminyl-diphospho-decaprenol L-rhamnosyltransferase